MTNTYRVNFLGGVNFIQDKALFEEGGFISYLDNAELRTGRVRSYRDPVRVTTAATSSTQIFFYRGKFYESALLRSYATEYVGQIERIYYSEYGSNPQKIIDGTTVPLGTPAPVVAPGVGSSTALTPANVVATESAGGGSYAVNRHLSYRVAFQTEGGIQVPSAKAVIVTGANNAAAHITWATPPSTIKVKKVLIFGPDEDKERRLAEIAPSQNYYDDVGLASASGELASSYDNNFTAQYLYTFVRRVNNVFNESGPSPLSLEIKSTATRSVTFNLASDGYWSSTNLVSYNSGTWAQITTTASGSLGGTIALASFSVDAGDGRVLWVWGSNHNFSDGAVILLENFTDANFNNKTRTVRWVSNNSFYTDDTVAPTDVSVTGRTARIVVSSTLATWSYQATQQAVLFTTTTPHTYRTGDYLYFAGVGNTNYDSQTIQIMVPAGSTTTFLVSGLPTPTVVGGATVTLALTRVNSTTQAPNHGDVVNMTLIDQSTPTNLISGYFTAQKVSTTAFNIPKYTASAITANTSTSSMQWVPFNDYIFARRLYRSGDTGDLLKVYDVPLDTATYSDTTATDRLGDPISSFYSTTRGDVVYDVPPYGLEQLTQHYGMLFGIDGNVVRWTPVGVPDAWPTTYKRSFEYRPLALSSHAGALMVLCEDALYRLDGTDSNALVRTKTKAEDGCIAAGSVQKTSKGLIYLSKRGLCITDGSTSQCITDLRIDGRTLRAPSGAVGTSFWALPASWQHLYHNMAAQDGKSSTYYGPSNLAGTNPIEGDIRAVKSFYAHGKYYMYWASGYNDYNAHSMICVDLHADGMPISTLGIKPLHVCVGDDDNIYCLLPYSPPPTLVTITVA